MKRLVFQLLIISALSITSNAKYSGGSGEPNTPYQIANVNDLLTLANDINDYNKCFIMIADINLDPNLIDRGVFTSAVIAPDTNNSSSGFQGAAFNGNFDGAGYKIIKMTIDTNGAGNDFLGLFGDINAGEVKNLRMENVKITGGNESYYLGGLAGGNYYSTISNCSSKSTITGRGTIGGLVGGNEYSDIEDCYSIVTITGSGGMGGLVGQNDHGNINNCYSISTVNGGSSVGGLVGSNTNGIISNCSSTSTVSGGNQSIYLGGLVGANSGLIRYCSSSGRVTHGYNTYIGGLVGSNSGSISECNSSAVLSGGNNTYFIGGLSGYNTGSISKCYSTGRVSGGNGGHHVGGLAGLNISSISNCYSAGNVSGTVYIGGLVGYSSSGSISNCYSKGTVRGDSLVGGLVGYNNEGSISSSYFLFGSGPTNGYGTPRTDAQLKQQSTFVGWDFVWEIVNGPNDIWAICEDVNYPKLAWQYIVGDSDNDKDVDFVDFAPLGLKWLQTDSHLYCGGNDLTGDGLVNFEDLDAFVENWLQ